MTTDPLQIVLFGGAGDLAQKKLLPALFDLYMAQCLPEDFSLIGSSRRSLTDEAYREVVREALGTVDEVQRDAFLEHVYFFSTDSDALDSFKQLNTFLNQSKSHRVFHLAVAPQLYESFFKNIAEASLTKTGEGYWTRILVEKPFGNNKGEAQRLDSLLGELFKETQIFRVDHYIAKEAIQNLLTFRFANSLFESQWNSDHIASVDVRVYESFDIRERGASYDGVGALRDVGQNHVLQMLALSLMHDPESMDADKIRAARAQLLTSLAVGAGNSIRGQYVGYRETDGVTEQSQTETYFKVPLVSTDPRWKDVPLTIESGKALDRTCAEIEVRFKKHHSHICAVGDDCQHQNKILFTIQPDEHIAVTLYVKKPGYGNELEEKTLSFSYADFAEERLPDAYERVLYDAIRGDQTLFVSTQEVQEQWRIIEEIMDGWKDEKLVMYEKGSDPEDFSSH